MRLLGAFLLLFPTVVFAASPVVHVPVHVQVEATGPRGAVAEFEVSASSGTLTCSHQSGALFPLGLTTVRCTATDDSGSGSGEFNVYVSDTTPPVMTLPSEILLESTQRDGAIVHYTATAVDLVDGPVPVNCSRPSGSLFPVWRTEVRCAATDSHTESAVGSFYVTVVAAVRPMLMLPDPITVPATSSEGAVVEFEVRGMDPNEGHVAVVCTPPSGSLFPIGRSTVTCVGTASSNGATDTGSFYVTVMPSTAPPTLVLPADVSVIAATSAGTIVSFEVKSNGAVTCTPASDSLFAIGTTRVSCTATFASGASTSGSFNVTVVEGPTPPTLVLPDDITVTATSEAGAEVTYVVTSDAPVGCTPTSGSLFPIGTTTVVCIAAAGNGGIRSGTFDVTVVEKGEEGAPTLTLPADMMVEATSNAGAVVVFEALSHAPVVCTPPSGSIFPLGQTIVTCTATAANGKSTSGSFSVVVFDVDAPVIESVTATPAVLFPPDHKMVPVTVTVVTNEGLARIVKVTANEPIAANDWRITGPLTVELRAERTGQSLGRIYTIHVEVTDEAGNRTTGSVDVRVLHDNGNPGTLPPAAPTRRRAARR
ncbi:MAG TPA: HYR domain-containing protein [Thermoanaerobaculia bacterium]|jgi:hypothetical protein